MPWMETDALTQRRRFVEDVQSGRWTMSAACARYGVSRPTGYLWLARYEAGGEAGLEPRRSAPHTCPHQTSPALARQIVAARQQYGWGAKKLRQVLRTQHPEQAWPARST